MAKETYSWGFYAHQRINAYAVYLLPPSMIRLYKENAAFLSEHATDPDKRRYVLPQEGARHYIDLDHYGSPPYDSLPRTWQAALARYPEDSLLAHGIAPWWIGTMMSRLTAAFRSKDQLLILKYSAEIGHYISDIHVPLHACSNYNGQLSGQHGIHGFWESRIPELLAEKKEGEPGWDFFIGQAAYIPDPVNFAWQRIMESAAAADTVLRVEKKLSASFPAAEKYAFEPRNGVVVRCYSASYTKAYDKALGGMTERRMRQSVFATASLWYTAWVNAGQPDLDNLNHTRLTSEEKEAFDRLNASWRKNNRDNDSLTNHR